MTKDFTPINGDTGIQEPHRHTPPQKAPRRRTRAWERPSVAVELIVLSVFDADLKVLLYKRQDQPFEGVWSLPGGFVRVHNTGNQGEGLEEAAYRELAEATGLPTHACRIEQLCAFGKAGRDPRMRVISVAWIALMSSDCAPLIQPDPDKPCQWFSTNEEVPWMRLSFDHAEILDAAIQRVREKMDHSSIAFGLVPDTFTVGELRDAHEAIQSRRYDARNFRRKFQRMIEEGVVMEAPGKRHRGKARPAKVWKLCGN